MKLSAVGKTSESDVVGDSRPASGRYLAAVKYCKNLGEKVQFNLEMLGGTTPGQSGRCLDEKFDTEGKHVCKLIRLAMSLFDMTTGKPVLAPNVERDVDFESCVGCLTVVEVEPNEFVGKNGETIHTTRLKYLGTWQPGHAEVRDVMACPEVVQAKEFLRLNGYKAGDGEVLAPQQAAAAAQSPPQAVAATGLPHNPFANI